MINYILGALVWLYVDEYLRNKVLPTHSLDYNIGVTYKCVLKGIIMFVKIDILPGGWQKKINFTLKDFLVSLDSLVFLV